MPSSLPSAMVRYHDTHAAAYDVVQATELDRRRIGRALEDRVRYRYVTPQVDLALDGFRIVSPCCSRNIDPAGGKIDIARLEYDGQLAVWRLYSKNHAASDAASAESEWVLQAEGRLHELLELLKTDPHRIFWQ